MFVSTQNQTQAQEWELKETGTSKEWYIINKTGRVYVTASNSKSPQILFLRFDARNKREKLLILILPGQNWSRAKTIPQIVSSPVCLLVQSQIHWMITTAGGFWKGRQMVLWCNINLPILKITYYIRQKHRLIDGSIKSVQYPGKLLAVDNSGTADYTPILTWNQTSGANQFWTLQGLPGKWSDNLGAKFQGWVKEVVRARRWFPLCFDLLLPNVSFNMSISSSWNLWNILATTFILLICCNTTCTSTTWLFMSDWQCQRQVYNPAVNYSPTQRLNRE